MIFQPRMNIFNAHPGWAIVNPVNCVGLMGAGLARQFASEFGQHYLAAYRRDCSTGSLTPYTPTLYYHSHTSRLIVNFPTKHHWRQSSCLACISKALAALPALLKSHPSEPTGVVFPQIGCGLGGLDWTDVCPLIISSMHPWTSPPTKGGLVLIGDEP